MKRKAKIYLSLKHLYTSDDCSTLCILSINSNRLYLLAMDGDKGFKLRPPKQCFIMSQNPIQNLKHIYFSKRVIWYFV